MINQGASTISLIRIHRFLSGQIDQFGKSIKKFFRSAAAFNGIEGAARTIAPQLMRSPAFIRVHLRFAISDEQVQSLLDKTAKAASRGEFEPFKTTSIFDSTAQHPEWLGEEPQRVKQLMPG